jgi:hypothetical protein
VPASFTGLFCERDLEPSGIGGILKKCGNLSDAASPRSTGDKSGFDGRLLEDDQCAGLARLGAHQNPVIVWLNDPSSSGRRLTWIDRGLTMSKLSTISDGMESRERVRHL